MATELAAILNSHWKTNIYKMASSSMGLASHCFERSNYFRSLDISVAQRYESKIKVIEGKDPYTLKENEWCENLEQLPNVTYPDLADYFVFTKSAYTLKEFKAFKCFDAISQFTGGWVRDVKFLKKNNHFLISAKVLHSQSLSEKPLDPWIIVEADGTIQSAHCTCMAGLGESCTHIAAALFYVEMAVRHMKDISVTGRLSYWAPPTMKSAPFKSVSSMDFSTPKRLYEKLEECTSQDSNGSKDNVAGHPFKLVPQQSVDEYHEFLGKLDKTDGKLAILSVVHPFSKNFIRKPKPVNDVTRLQSFYNEDYITLSLESLVQQGSKLKLEITDHQAAEIEIASRKQSASKCWFEHRAGRITASRFKSACNTRSAVSAPSLVKAICYPELCKFKYKATEWGCKHEKTARKAYVEFQKQQHINFSDKDVGLLINPEYPHFGATPDAVVWCDCHGHGCVEIKCPFCIKETSVEEKGDLISCLTRDKDGLLMLDLKHSYYFQVQAQIFISKMDYCDFVIWSPKGTPHVERIFPNMEFWKKEAPKATIFFQEAVLPELLGKYFSKDTHAETRVPLEDNQKWCFCKKDKGGKMVMCEKEGCKILWYHTTCLRLKKIPKGKFVCAKCKTK